MWHSLDESGNISVYDVAWPTSGVQVNVPASMLEGVKMTEHENEGEAHGAQDEKYACE